MVNEQPRLSYGLAFLPGLLLGILNSLVGAIPVLYYLALLMSAIFPFFVSVAYLRIARKEKLSWEHDVTKEINKNLKRYTIASLLSSFFIFLWGLLFVIPGYIKQFSYSMTPFIMKDDDTISPTKAITKSREMMRGNKGSLFSIYCSYYIEPLLTLFVSGIFSGLSLYLLVNKLSYVQLSNGLVFIFMGTSIVFFVWGTVKSIMIVPKWNMTLALFYENLLETNKINIESVNDNEES